MKNIKRLLAATSIAFILMVAGTSTGQAQSIVVRTGPIVHHRVYHHRVYHHRHVYHRPYHRPYHRY